MTLCDFNLNLNYRNQRHSCAIWYGDDFPEDKYKLQSHFNKALRATCEKKYFSWLDLDGSTSFGIKHEDIPFFWSKLSKNDKLMKRYLNENDPCHCVPIIMDEKKHGEE